MSDWDYLMTMHRLRALWASITFTVGALTSALSIEMSWWIGLVVGVVLMYAGFIAMFITGRNFGWYLRGKRDVVKQL